MNNSLKTALKLLEIAHCPNCDGGGGIQKRSNLHQTVTREMALDVGMPELEGTPYVQEGWITEECQWCFEKNQLFSVIKGDEQ